MTPRRSLIDALAAMPGRLAAAAWADNRPMPVGEWTAHEIVLHLVAVEEAVWQARLAQLRVEDGPTWAWVEPGPWDGAAGSTMAGALATFTARRSTTIAHLEGLDDAGWRRHGIHATFGELDVAGLVQVALDHDAVHLASLATEGRDRAS